MAAILSRGGGDELRRHYAQYVVIVNTVSYLSYLILVYTLEYVQGFILFWLHSKF